MTHKSILAPGIHDLTEPELENHFLSGFTESGTRAELIDNLKQFLAALSALGIEFEVWLDGSFTTLKMDPNDIDLVAFASAKEIETLAPDKQSLAKTLLGNNVAIRQNLKLDVYFSAIENAEWRSYWRGWFGFDRNESPKGIARLKVQPS